VILERKSARSSDLKVLASSVSLLSAEFHYLTLFCVA
jgi:hypothetical protein